MATLLGIFVSAAIVNNFTFNYFLGLCPFMGVSARISTALRLGAADVFVLVITALCTWVLNTFVLTYANRGDGDKEVQPAAVPRARDVPAAHYH
jgi:electron transport complex protein RnfA